MTVASHALREATLAVFPLVNDYELWARTCYRIRNQKGESVPLRLRPAQRRIGEIEAEEIAKRGYARISILKARRAGFSTDQQARAFHLVWSTPGVDALTLAHTQDDTAKLFQITRRAKSGFNPALLLDTGKKDTYELAFPEIDSHFFTATAGSLGPGRGSTLRRVHGSEFAHWREPLETLAAITPAMEGVPRNVIVLETTASAHDSAAHRHWIAAKEGANGYRPLFFPWWECDPQTYRIPLLAPDELGAYSGEEVDLVRRFDLAPDQIKWRRARILEFGKQLFLQEYAEDEETCWLVGGALFYEFDAIKAMETRKTEPMRREMNGALQVFSEEMRGERAILGADTAEGVDGDRSTFCIRSFPSWRLLATFESALIAPKEFAGLINEWGKFYRGALLVIEKNSHGITVLRELRDTHSYSLDRIYHRTPLDKERDEQHGRMGWVTTAGSLGLMLDAGLELINEVVAGNAEAPNEAAIRDAYKIKRSDDGKAKAASLNGKDAFVAEMLAWIGRGTPVYSGGGVVRMPMGY